MQSSGHDTPAQPEIHPDMDRGMGLNRALILSLYLPAIAAGLGTGITTPVLPILAKSFDVSVGVASLVFIVHMAGSTAGTLPTGYLLDKIGRRKMLLTGPMVAAAASFLIIIADSFTELLIYRFIGGWGQQMWMLSRMTVIADTAGTYQRGRQITSMFSAQRVGTLAGPLIGGFIAVAWDIRVPFALHGIVMLLAVIPSFYIIEESMPSPRDASRSEGDDSSDKLAWRTFFVKPIPAVLSAQFLVNITRGGIEGGGILFLYAVYAYGAGPGTLGVLSSVMAAAGIPISLVAGYFMDRRGRKFTVVPGTIGLGAAMLFMAITAYASLPFSAFVGAFFALHSTASLLSGSMQTIGTDIAPVHGRGMFFGISRSFSMGGRVASPTSFALMSELAGFGAAFTLLSATSVAGGIVLALLVRETLGMGARAETPADTAASDPRET